MSLPYLFDLVDLHCHLSTSVTTHLLWEMAHQRGIKLPHKDYWKFLESTKLDPKNSYHSYHDYYDLVQKVQSSPDAIENSVYEAISLSYRKANITQQEIRFNPMRRNMEGLYDLDRIIFSALVGMKKASMIYPVKTGLIIEMDRRFDEKLNAIIANKAIEFRNEGVVGLDISGPAVPSFKMSDIVKPVEKAKSFGLGITIHTGEEGEISEMWEVLEKLSPNRLGHGIMCIKDEKLMAEIVKRGISLEVCPSSNLSLKLVKNWQEVGKILNTLKQNGVPFNINSDAPVILNTNVKNEYEKLIENEIFTLEDVKKSIKTARKHSFIKD